MGRVLQFSDVHFGCEHADACQAAHPELEVVKAPYLNDHPLVIDTFIERTGRHFMQQRLPQMAMITIHQRDFRFFATPQLSPQLSRQFQSTGTATYDYDFFQWCSHETP